LQSIQPTLLWPVDTFRFLLEFLEFRIFFNHATLLILSLAFQRSLHSRNYYYYYLLFIIYLFIYKIIFCLYFAYFAYFAYFGFFWTVLLSI
jgi:hypothetical protein